MMQNFNFLANIQYVKFFAYYNLNIQVNLKFCIYIMHIYSQINILPIKQVV